MDPKEGQHHSSAEAQAVIDGLPEVYFLRLLRDVRPRIVGNSRASAEDVVLEIYLRFVDGRRRWPIGVPIEVCFKNAVKSEISNSWGKHRRDAARLPAVKVDQLGVEVDPADELPGDFPDPAEARIEAEERKRLEAIADHIQNSFKDDDAVTAVIIGRIEKMSPEQVQQAFDLTPTDYKSACRKLRRFLNKHYADGWKSHGQQQPESEKPSI